MATRGRPPKQRTAPPVSWTSDDGETVLMPAGVTPTDTGAATGNVPDANGSSQPESEPESAADRVVEMIVRNRERDRSKIKVWKVLESGELSFCNDYAPDLFEQQNLNLIRRQFGAGKYRIEIYAHNPISKRFSCFGREIVHISEVFEPNDPEDIAERIAQRMGAVVAAPAAASQPLSQMAQIKELLQLATLMREALGLNVPPPPPPPPMASQLAELLNIMKGARELAAEIDPPPEQSDPLMKLAEQAMPIISKAIEQQVQRSPLLAPVQLPPTLADVPAKSGESAVTNDEFGALREAIGGINTLAYLDADHELAATMIFDKIPDEARPILEGTDWFAKLCEIEPKCQRHQAWYGKVRDLLLRFWKEDDAEPEQAGDLPAAA